MIFDSMNIHVLNSRVLQYTDPEFRKVINAIQGASFRDLYVDNSVRKELDRPFIVLQEYIPGIYLLQMGKKRAEACFGLDPEMGYRRLREIGEIIAMDILLNNSTRIPVIWNSEGNSNNFLISVKGTNLNSNILLDPNYNISMDHIYAIDTCCNCLEKIDENSERIYDQYLERVDRFVRGTVRDLDDTLQGKTLGLLVLPTMEIVKEFFYKYTRLELNSAQLFQILKGVMGTFKEIADIEDSEIEEIYIKLKNLPEQDWMDLWRNGLDKIQVQFLLDVRDTIKNIVSGNSRSFEWVYAMYKIDDLPLYF